MGYVMLFLAICALSGSILMLIQGPIAYIVITLVIAAVVFALVKLD